MKLSESIDLFRRRFRFVAVDDGVKFVYVDLHPNLTKFLVLVDSDLTKDDTIKIQAAYNRKLEDIPEAAVKVIRLDDWRHFDRYKLIWTSTGLAEYAPKA